MWHLKCEMQSARYGVWVLAIVGCEVCGELGVCGFREVQGGFGVGFGCWRLL
jgi:hypothetical protein